MNHQWWWCAKKLLWEWEILAWTCVPIEMSSSALLPQIRRSLSSVSSSSSSNCPPTVAPPPPALPSRDLTQWSMRLWAFSHSLKPHLSTLTPSTPWNSWNYLLVVEYWHALVVPQCLCITWSLPPLHGQQQQHLLPSSEMGISHLPWPHSV